MKRGRVLRTMMAFIALVGALGETAGAAPASARAAGSLDFTVTDAASGGIYARFEPHTADKIVANGYGVYPNDQVRLLCGVTDGDPYGPYNNPTWHFIEDLSRPGEGAFWVNDHLLNTPISAGQLASGESRCPAETGNPLLMDNANHTTTTTDQVNDGLGNPSLFISGSDDPTGTTGVQVATQDINYTDLGNNCSPAVLSEMIGGVSTLVVWSRGRVGVLMYLKHAGPERLRALHRIILIDPGNAATFADSCDGTPPPGEEQYDANVLLQQWLALSPENQLLILSGQFTEDRSWWGLGGPTFNGLKQYYLAGIAQWDQTPGHTNLSLQVLVCDYNDAGHEQIMQDLFQVVQQPPSLMCPVALNGDLPSPVVEQPYP